MGDVVGHSNWSRSRGGGGQEEGGARWGGKWEESGVQCGSVLEGGRERLHTLCMQYIQ